MSETPTIFVSHTNKPGGGELALRRYLAATKLPVRLVTMEPGGVWEGLDCDIVVAKSLIGLRRVLAGHTGLVVGNSMRAAFFLALTMPRRARLVYWVRDGLLSSAMSTLALWLTRSVTARRTSHFIANSEWTAETVCRALGVSPEAVHVVPSMCGVGPTVEPVRTEPHQPLRLLYLGRLSPWKAPHVAVRSLKHLRARGVAVRLTIAGAPLFGEQGYEQELRQLIRDEPEASVIGHVEDIRALLAAHDILVHCSVSPEPFGQVIVQGLAAAVPVLATGHGGPMDVLSGAPESLLYTPGDEEALASSVLRVLADYEAISDWARQRARVYSDEQVLVRMDDLIQLIGGRP